MSENITLISNIYDSIETGNIDRAVFTCLRLSRNIEDTFNTAMFLRELYPDFKQLKNAFYDEVNHMNTEIQSNIWNTTSENWIEERTLSFSLSTTDPNKNLLALGVGEMQKEIIHIKETINDLKTPVGMGEHDTAAFTDSYDHLKGQYRLRLSAIYTIQERIRTRCLNYASRVENRIRTQERPIAFLEGVQNLVNNYFAANSDETYRKLQKASLLVESNNSEDYSLLLTSVRRSINSAADYFYPPIKGSVICIDGIEREMDKEHYLNRLHEYCSINFTSSTSDELFKSELNYLIAVAKKLNSIASKGTHSEVTSLEAKQGLIGLYLFLYNIVNKIILNGPKTNSI